MSNCWQQHRLRKISCATWTPCLYKPSGNWCVKLYDDMLHSTFRLYAGKNIDVWMLQIDVQYRLQRSYSWSHLHLWRSIKLEAILHHFTTPPHPISQFFTIEISLATWLVNKQVCRSQNIISEGNFAVLDPTISENSPQITWSVLCNGVGHTCNSTRADDSTWKSHQYSNTRSCYHLKTELHTSLNMCRLYLYAKMSFKQTTLRK